MAAFGLGFLANASLWLAIWLRFRGVREAVPLDYDIYFGINAIGSWTRLFKLPAFGLVILAANLFLVAAFAKKEKFVGYFLSLAALLVQLLLMLEEFLVLSL